MKNDKVLLNVITFLLAFTICEGYIIQNLYYLIGLSFISLVVYCLHTRNDNLMLKRLDLLWLFAIEIVFICVLYSPDQNRAIKYAVTIFVLFLIMVILRSCNYWRKYFVNNLLICSSVHVFATIIRVFHPISIENICIRILPPEKYELNLNLMLYSGNAGITGQTADNAFYISIFIAITFISFLLSKKLGIPYASLTVIGFIALFLTNKRGLLVANIAAIILILAMLGKINVKSFLKYIIYSLLLAGVIYCFVQINPYLQNVFLRFIDNKNFTSNRNIIYESVLNKTWESLLIGHGTSSIDTIIGTGGHNIYLQLLFENGIIGCIIFIIVFIAELAASFKIVKKNAVSIKENQNEAVFILIGLYMQISFLVYGLVGNPLYDFEKFAVYLLSIALIKSYTLKNESTGRILSGRQKSIFVVQNPLKSVGS